MQCQTFFLSHDFGRLKLKDRFRLDLLSLIGLSSCETLPKFWTRCLPAIDASVRGAAMKHHCVKV